MSPRNNELTKPKVSYLSGSGFFIYWLQHSCSTAVLKFSSEEVPKCRLAIQKILGKPLLYCYIIKTSFNYVRRALNPMIHTVNPIRLLGFYYPFQHILKFPPPINCAECSPGGFLPITSLSLPVQSAKPARFPLNRLPKCVSLLKATEPRRALWNITYVCNSIFKL